MILVWFIVIPLIAGVLAWIVAGWSGRFSRWLSLLFLAGDLILALGAWLGAGAGTVDAAGSPWIYDLQASWIPQFGIGFHLAMDGLSLLLVILTLLLGIACVVCSWSEIDSKVGFFHFCLLTTITGIVGVFLAVDLFLFYVFWEVMLVPMYILIAVWGHENRLYSAIKFFIFTQAGGLLMLAAILGLYYIHGADTGTYTFDYFHLVGTSLAPATAAWLMLGFSAAFAVKLPMFGLHSWLPDAHTEAPTAGSVILAGLLLKTGGYGFLRFVIPLFPEASATYASLFMGLGAAGIIYGAVTAFAQTDLKRLVAYTSVSHMGFVLIGVFSLNAIAMQGAVVTMLAHGITTSALFMIAGLIQERIHTRDLDRMGGFWTSAPIMGGISLVFVAATMGVPGLGNFVGEFLVLVGVFQVDKVIAVFAVGGLILSVPYALRIMYRTFFGPMNEARPRDLGARECILFSPMIIIIAWLGLFPNTVINTSRPSLEEAISSRPSARVELSLANRPAETKGAPAAMAYAKPRTERQ